MLPWLKKLTQASMEQSYQVFDSDVPKDNKIKPSLSENMIALRSLLENSSDLQAKAIEGEGCTVRLLACEGMTSQQSFSELLAEPLTKAMPQMKNPQQLLEWVRVHSALSMDQQELYTYTEVFQFLMSGFAVLLIDGIPLALAFGLQGFSYRSISEPSGEVNVRGSREGFVEPVRINMTMIRRRLKTPKLKFELFQVGEKSRTDVCMVYLTDRASESFVTRTRRRLQSIRMDIVLESAYLQPFLEKRPFSFFSGVGTTERPDTLCAKIAEGRIAVLVDGTPFALILPYLFNEHFQTLDDYTHRPYYAVFIRVLKYLAFYFTILLPGLYVAIGMFHPELFPHALLSKVAAAEQSTPFPLMIEALLIHLIYEIMREAGLRLPRPIGHAIGIVGALVIGDAAVTAGLIGSPMVMVVALTAISSFVIPSLYDSVTVLKFLFILAGGFFGLFGITLGMAMLMVNLCAVSVGGVPATSPATPFSLYALRDLYFRAGWRSLGKRTLKVEDLPGSEMGR